MADYETAKKSVQLYDSLLNDILNGKADPDGFSKGMVKLYSNIGFGTDSPKDPDYVQDFLAPFLEDAKKAISLRAKNPRAFLSEFAEAEGKVYNAFIGRYLTRMPTPKDDNSDLFKMWKKNLEQLTQGSVANYWDSKIRQELGGNGKTGGRRRRDESLPFE